MIEDRSGSVHKYERYIPGRLNSHNEATCTECLERQAEYDARRRNRMNAEYADCEGDVGMSPPSAEYEAIFESVGLGLRQDNNCEGMEDVFGRSCNGVRDIIITGTVRCNSGRAISLGANSLPVLQTEVRHGLAWGFFRFLGRIRRWDGLIAILRVPMVQSTEPLGHGNMIFTGYLVGGQNIIGNMRVVSNDVGVPGWESSFTLSKVSE
jgi:hypothetical protein